MATEEHEVIVVGGGTAGVACAGALAARGHRPLLISETAEVGHNLRSVTVGGLRCGVQHPTWHVAWGGGGWFPLVRELNIRTRFTIDPPLQFTIRGLEKTFAIPVCVSAGSLTDFLMAVSPLPLDDAKDEIEHLLNAGLRLSWEELFELHEVSIDEWLDQQKADAAGRFFLTVLAANLSGMSAETAGRDFSVLGVFGLVRAYMCGEAAWVSFDPDAREGLVVPIARRVEELGGTVWRKARVSQIVPDGDGSITVVMDDGREVCSGAVALATGNHRIEATLDPLPDEFCEPMKLHAELRQREFSTCTVLNKPVVEPETIVAYSDLDGSALLMMVPQHALAPWSTDGRQLVFCESNFSPARAEEMGGPEKIYEYMHGLCEEFFPGWNEAIDDTVGLYHDHLWTYPLLAGPKMPRRVGSVEGLWHVGDASVPVRGFGVDGAASAGYLGGIEIAETLGEGS